jgi:hypothetical protein
MKKIKIITPLCLFLSFYLGQAQLIMIDGETGEYKYEEVVEAPGLSSNELKERAQKWLSTYYVSEDSIQSDSLGITKLCSQRLDWTLIRKVISIELFFDVNLKFKEGRYKYAFENFREGKMVRDDLQSITLKTYIERFPQVYQINIEEPVDSEVTKAINSLKFFMANGHMEMAEDDW